MLKIYIEINEFLNIYTLTGATKELLNNRRAKIYLKDYLDANIINEEEIQIPFNVDNKQNSLEMIRRLLKKHKFQEENSELVEESLSDYFQEEKNFEDFSKKAYDIRNNIVDANEFKEFTNSLEANLTNRTLYDLQLLSAFHLAFSQNACNFSVPGAGKTSIVYGAYAYLKNISENHAKKVDRILIISPLSAFGPWEKEYEECFGQKVKSKRLSGNVAREEKTEYFYSSDPAELTLISYQGLPSIKDDLIYFLRKHKVMVVLDEAHRIKNTQGGIIAETALDIAKYCKSRFILTGTPAPNGYEDMINLFSFIWPTKRIIKFRKFQLEEMSENPKDERIQTFIKNVSPFFIRIKKRNLGIPEPINHPPIMVEMDKTQREIYDFIENDYMKYIMEKNQKSELKSLLVKARLIRLMQVATNPSLLKNPIEKYYSESGFSTETFIDDTEIIRKIINYSSNEVPSKFKATANLVKKIIDKGEKVIIWLTFVQNMKELQNYLESLNISSRLLYGDVPVETEKDYGDIETREKIINEFHNDNSEFKVIIANPFATSESISLHKVCHNAIYVERSFNAAQFIQSKDRIHRYGLKKSDIINYYYIISRNSVEETIDQRLSFKEERMNNIIESEDIPLFKILEDEYEEDDIKVLIKNYVGRHN